MLPLPANCDTVKEAKKAKSFKRYDTRYTEGLINNISYTLKLGLLEVTSYIIAWIIKISVNALVYSDLIA